MDLPSEITVLNPYAVAEEGRYSVLVRFGALYAMLDMQALVPDACQSITVFVALKLTFPLSLATFSIILSAICESRELAMGDSGSEDAEANAVRCLCKAGMDDAIKEHNIATAASFLSITGIHPLNMSVIIQAKSLSGRKKHYALKGLYLCFSSGSHRRCHCLVGCGRFIGAEEVR